MKKTVHLTVVVGVSVLFVALPVSTQASGVLSGGDLLKAMREKNGEAQKPAYENRTKESTGDELLRAIPAESFFCVCINNLEGTLSQAEQYLDGVLPTFEGILFEGFSAPVRGQPAVLLGDLRLSGVNMQGSFAFFATLMPTEDIVDFSPMLQWVSADLYMVLLIPVTDYEQFVKDNPNIGPPDKKGVSKVESIGLEVGRLLVTNAGGFALFTLPNRYDMLLGTADTVQSKSARGLGAVLDAGDAKRAMAEPIWAHINVGLLADSNIPAVVTAEQDPNAAMLMMDSDPVGGVPVEMSAVPADFEKRMEEIRSITLTLRPTPNTLTIGCTIRARSGTETAGMFKLPRPILPARTTSPTCPVCLLA
jgi:hypothetical protein